MKPTEYLKNTPFKSLREIAQYTGEPKSTLVHWFNERPNRFDLILRGAIDRKYEEMMKNG